MLFFSVVSFLLAIIGLINTVPITPWENYLELGKIERPLGLIVNQSSLAHQHFVIGYLCLHSFMYDTAQDAFELAIDEDPTLVEAHVGRLLGHKYPLWSYTNRSGALQIWDNTWALFTEHNVILTPLQSVYLNTVYQWFLHENISYGEQAFLISMINLTQEFPSEIDAQTLLGLSYLNVAYHEMIKLKMLEPPALLAARKVLEATIVIEPSHPGSLHYLIHAFDVPRLGAALQGVPYAHKYGQVARTASHAQHMPTHIWIHIGAWSLAQKADERAIEVSLSLCMVKLYQINFTQFVNETSSMTFSKLLARLDSSQFRTLLSCDQENRAHSQEWLVYSYLQTGRFWMSVGVLHDLMLSHNISYPEKFYLSHAYHVRAFIAIDAFFWAMRDRQKNQERFLRTMDEILVRMDHQPIQILTDNTTSNSHPERSELLARYVECIRLLVINPNDAQEINYHLLRMNEISSIMQSKTRFTPARVFLMMSQITALRWCLQGFLSNCLIELDRATRLESSLDTELIKPDLILIRSAELFAFYLLIIHRHYSSLASTYVINNRTITVNDFPLYALQLYAKENFTDPHRGVNLLGMARAYAQMERSDKASQLYEKLLQEWAESSFSSNLDKLVVEEAIDYLLETQILRTRNNAHLHYFSFILYAFCFFVVSILIK